MRANESEKFMPTELNFHRVLQKTRDSGEGCSVIAFFFFALSFDTIFYLFLIIVDIRVIV